MKRVFSIIGWTAGAFIATAMAIGFASGILFYFLAMSGAKSDTVPRFMGWLGIIVPLIVAAIVLLIGLRGRLPGTRPPTPPAPSLTPGI
jgi:hypothetical protein